MRSWCYGGVVSLGIGAALLCAAPPAQADVVAKSDIGFVVRVATEVTASPAQTWATMMAPAQWWSSQHTFSGDAVNLTLDPVPGGCFCEKMPVPKGAPAGQKPGGVQHLRVIYVDPVHAIRMSGALGPLQSEALLGTLTMTIKPTGAGTRVLWEYVVGGFMRYKADDIAPAVDRMLASQLSSLAEKLGPVKVVQPQSPPPEGPPSEPQASEIQASMPEGVPPPTAVSQSGAGWSLPPSSSSVVKAPAKAPAKAAAAPPAKPAAKPARKPAAKSDDIAPGDVNAAFDAALGDHPAP